MIIEHLSIFLICYLFDLFIFKLLCLGLYCFYYICNRYVNYVIESPNYISNNMDDDSDAKTEYSTCYRLQEYIDASESNLSFISNKKYIVMLYKHIKYSAYPFELLYHKSNIINLPRFIKHCDNIYSTQIIKICVFIMELRFFKYCTQKIKTLIIKKMTPILMQITTRQLIKHLQTHNISKPSKKIE